MIRKGVKTLRHKKLQFVIGWVAVLAAQCGFAAGARAEPALLTSADRSACGAFSVISGLVHESLLSDPGPGSDFSRTYDLVGLADALNNIDKEGISSDLDRDITAYVYELATLGAAINHNEQPNYAGLRTTRDQLADRCQLWNMSRYHGP
ncbi:Uncharacterised protein [Mycobacteroides abscessus subsp. massiliense]|nr:Uncharacterised protein [Mycobacteroides abscessus subsp. massiliense]SLJ49206.1 Uncharacterised protein [Mycobacteroides abscessus subsp. abscessus]